MNRFLRTLGWPAALAALLALGLAADAHAAVPTTVCTITVNSSDEKEAFRRNLPPGRYRFVELVERGRPDWLESARRSGLRCDVLIISGHYDGGDYAGGNEFFSEHVDTHEYLPVEEMERVACSADDGLFSHLKAVYLFGCNTLNPQPLRGDAAEIVRNLVRSGRDPRDAGRLARALSERYADSSRDRMRHIFKGVPAIYGFASVAPLGPLAATYLERYFRAGGAREVGSGHPSTAILDYFPGHSMTLTRGSIDADPDTPFRRDVCRFFDERVSPADRARFVRGLLDRDMAEVRPFFDRLERYAASLDDAVRRSPGVAPALAAIAGDEAARARYLDFMRRIDKPQFGVRMIDLAAVLGWLSDAQKRAELTLLIRDAFARSTPSAADVDFVCTLDRDREFDDARRDLAVAAQSPDDAGHAAMLACLGDERERPRVLRAIASPRDADVEIARVYLQHRPLADVSELRDVAAQITRMSDPAAQAQALDALAQDGVSDPETLGELARLFPVARSIGVQRAIAGVLLRADYGALAGEDLARTLRDHRLKSPGGRDVIDVLIDRLQPVAEPVS